MPDFLKGLKSEMRYMKRLAIFTIFLLLAASSSWSQTRNAFITAAESAFERKDFYSALHYYQNALEYDDQAIEILYKTAESARLFNAYSLAEIYYDQVANLQQNGEFALTTFWLAEMQKRLGKYELAKGNYQIYLSENALDNAYYTNAATKQIEDCDWALEQIQNPRSYISLERLDENINTPYSEFGPISMGDSLIYSSLRFPLEGDEVYPKRPFSKVLVSIDGIEGLPFGPEEFNSQEMHTAHLVFSPAMDRVYLTLCEYLNGTDIKCDLYYRDIVNGQLGSPIKLSEPINSADFTSTQPAVGLDPEGHQPALYFVSDRPGGKGKLDIWYTLIQQGGTFASPQNLSTVNTKENDITPFYHRSSQSLYFSSEGYQGFGGYDVYNAVLNGRETPVIENLGVPLNSSYNDVYFFHSDDEASGYLASNRVGTLFLDEDMQACCYDLFRLQFTSVDIQLKALVFDKSTQADLLGAEVILNEVNGISELVDRQTSENTNEFIFPLERNRSYQAIATKEGYFPDTILISTRDIHNSQELVRRFYLESKSLDLELFVFDILSRDPIRGAVVNLRDLSDPATEVIIQSNEMDNRFEFPLLRDRAYQIITSKKGYRTDTLLLNTTNIAGNNITRNIFLYRGELPDFLPLTVYFDNDQPVPKSWQSRTNMTYNQTYPPYIGRKDEYKSNFSEPLMGEAKVQADDDMERFFEFEIRDGRDNLQKFIEVLFEDLKDGKRVTLVVRGYASPLASVGYNAQLSNRRISSVRNQIGSHGGNAIRTYLQNGNLRIVEESLGETRAPLYVSDDYGDPRNSIYSIPASRERRVEIVEVRSH